ncbi:hypothetical protein ACFSC4_09935 [Deinococcus malanensis]|uniref:hypothetical protein n=1 Tax=Deinococcus malanensis TaxID=1706855 RepID=UPI0036277D58
MPDAFTLEQIFPPDAHPSALLRDFSAWHADTFTGAFCGYEIAPTRLDDYWIENGADLADHFALFLNLGDGSMVGYWYPEGWDQNQHRSCCSAPKARRRCSRMTWKAFWPASPWARLKMTVH